jgi:hypothetical protein
MDVKGLGAAAAGKGIVAPITLGGEDAVTTLAVCHPQSDRIVLSDAVPTSATRPLGPNVLRVPYSEFRRHVDAASPAIGLRPTMPWRQIDLNIIDNIADARVPRSLLWRGQYAAPPQTESWSCGVNSAARFAAMLGQNVDDYAAFLRAAPSYLGKKIGANAAGLQDHLRAQSSLRGTDLSQHCRRYKCDIMGHIKQCVASGRPAMVLLVSSGISMHWVNVVAQRRQDGNFIVLDTDGSLYEILGGEHALFDQMNADNCLAQKTGFIERYNSITCTAHCEVKGYESYDFDPNFYLQNNPDVAAHIDRLVAPGDIVSRWHQAHKHWRTFGIHEGRRPCAGVCYDSYLRRYADLTAAFGPRNTRAAARHWHVHGAAEGRNRAPS